jgi:hypothetical protein
MERGVFLTEEGGRVLINAAILPYHLGREKKEGNDEENIQYSSINSPDHDGLATDVCHTRWG